MTAPALCATCGHPRDGHSPFGGCFHDVTPGEPCPCAAADRPPVDTSPDHGPDVGLRCECGGLLLHTRVRPGVVYVTCDDCGMVR